MKRIISGVVLFFLAMASRTIASDRVIVYPLQNPSSTQQATIQRYPRISIGTFLRDALGVSYTGGTYNNLTISPGTGLYVTVAPSVANTTGSVYQQGQDDVNPIPVNVTPQLSADPTVIMLQGLFPANTTSTPLGPLTAPSTSGQSIYYLIEAQITQVDTNPQSVLFVNQANSKYYQTVNTTRSDAIVFQVKAGTASATPTVPTIDSGWISIGTVLVAYGQSSISSGNISMTLPFQGFSPTGGGSTGVNAGNGYFALSSGAIHQWGSVSSIPADGSNSSGTAILFATSFPNALYSFVATPTQNGSSFTDALSIQTKISGTSVWVYVTGGAPGSTCTVYYQADGH
jgi:hypothetical protein